MPLGAKISSIFSKKLRWIKVGTDQEQPAIKDSHDRPLHTQSGFLAGSSNVMYQPILIDNSQRIINGFDSGVAVLNALESFTTPEAAIDSSARDPPPRCHPGTRAQLHERLHSWLTDNQRPQNMIWLRGPAGSGKSAVAQTFAEHADEMGRLGAAFFFSRPNKRDKPLRLIPTLAYQLALHSPDYRALLTRQLVNNPLIPKAALRMQFKKLIAEPFFILVESLPSAPERLLIVLDGLDECEGEDAQCEIIKIVSEAAHPKSNLPFLWLLCSRPEPHIVSTFSMVESDIHIGREKLVLDLEARNDVDRYLRDGFVGICTKYSDILLVDMETSWPSEAEFNEISNAAAGLFIFAATVLKYIGDPEYANPTKQLQHLLAFLSNCQTQGAGVKSPWDILDQLYTRILSDIPDHTLPTTMRILGLYLSPWARETQACCNLLRLEQGEFYAALRRLHAVMEIPPPHEALKSRLFFHHASFRDYLQDRSRSHKYFVDEQLARAEMVKFSLHWLSLPEVPGHCTQPQEIDAYIPHFPWAPSGRMSDLVNGVLRIAFDCLEDICERTEHPGEISGLVSLISQCTFTNFVADFAPVWFVIFASKLYLMDQRCLQSGIVRIEIGNAVDAHHLKRLSILAGPLSLKPAPLSNPDSDYGDNKRLLYFFHGNGQNRCIVCYNAIDSTMRCCILKGDSHPSENECLEFHRYMLQRPEEESGG